MRTKTSAAIVAYFTLDYHRITREYRGSVKKGAMMLAAIKAMADPDPVWQARCDNPDLAAEATASEPVHVPLP